jgi:predicted Zn-dependent protease
VDFRRFLAFAALLLAAGACTLGNNPPQTAAQPGGTVLPREIEREVGPAYASPPLQALVDRVGQKVVSGAGLQGTYRFYVLDEPEANAHAISTGYVFVTRGLLALIEDEAELAAAFGHELGHVVKRHAAQREQQRKDVIGAAVDAALTSGSITVGRSVAREGLLKLRRYSRDQELEADHLGVQYIVKAGFRGSAMTTLIQKLQRQIKLEDRLMGSLSETAEHGALSTHPDPVLRLETLKTLAESQAAGEAGRSGYLAAVDGMSVDDTPEEGFVRDSSFIHPSLRLAFDTPADFHLFNSHDGVLGVGRDRSLLYFSCLEQDVPGPLDDWMRNQLKPTPANIERTEIGGAEAAVGAKPRGADVGLGQVRYVVIRHGDGLCYFNLLSEGPDRDRRIEEMTAAVRSFRTLPASEAQTVQPYRLHVVPAAGTTAAALAARMPYRDLRMERLTTLNGVDTPAELMRKAEIKIVGP